MEDEDHLPGRDVLLRSAVSMNCAQAAVAYAYVETVVEGVPLTLSVDVSPGKVGLGQSVNILCRWNRSLLRGHVIVNPEGDKLLLSDGKVQRDTVFVYHPSLMGDHQVVFTGTDLADETEKATEHFLVEALDYFYLDRNRLDVGRNDVLGIRYSLPKSSWVRLLVYNVAGEVVRVLYEGESGLGERRFVWDGRDSGGRVVSPGLYLVYFEATGKHQVAKVLVVR